MTPAREWLTSPDRITLVHRERGSATYAIAGIRATVHHDYGKRWNWRTWEVLGPMPIGSGMARTQRDANAACLAVIQAATGIKDLELP